MTDQPNAAPLNVRQPGPSRFSGLTAIWLVPIIALAVILSAAYQAYQERGVAIAIAFSSGAGIHEDTPIRYRDVEVGHVEKVSFSQDLEYVVATARVDQSVAPFLDEDASFWVVEPDVTLRGVSGLDTVLGGVYITGKWDNVAGEAQTSFVGLDTPPLLSGLERGVEILLRAQDGHSLAQGAPILHKGLQVGFLDTPELDRDGLGVTVRGFIEGEYADLITTNTRFWDTSGFSFTVGAEGLGLNVDSLASLIEGGIAFDTVVSGGSPLSLAEGPIIFDVFDTETDARDSLFESADQSVLTVGILFDENINGLSVGSGVKYQGVRVGDVSAIAAIVIEEEDRRRVQLRTTLELSPARFGIAEGTSDEDAMIIIAAFVANGMRARLTTGNILTGALEVELVDTNNTEIAFMETGQKPYPIIPTTTSNISGVAESAEGVLARINDLPIEALMQGAIDLMASVEVLARDGDLRAAPEELLGVLTDARTLIGSDGLQTAPQSVQETLDGIEEVVDQIAAILTDAAEADLVGSLSTTLTTTTQTVETINTAAAAVPEVLDQIAALSEKATALELEALIAQTTETLASIDDLVESEGVTALPGNVNAALDEVRGLVAAAQAEGGSVTALNAALAAAEDAARSVTLSMADVPALTERADTLLIQLQGSAANLPTITAEIEGIVTALNAAELDKLVTQATAALTDIETFIASDGVTALPDEANAALSQISTLIAEVRDGGAVENLNTALADASGAAQSVAASVEDLPALTARADALLVQLQAAAENLPKITAEVETLLITANAIELDAVVKEAEATLASITTFVGSDSTQALPGNLNTTLTELDGLLTAISEGGAVENVNGMLAAANDAAQAVEEAAEGLPALSREATRLVSTINSVAAVYGERGRFTADANATLRDIQEAADAVSALARAIQRNPSSILTGR